MRVVFFGTPSFAVPTLDRLCASVHHVLAVVTQPDRRRGRGHRVAPSPVKEAARRHGLELVQPERVRDDAFVDWLRAMAPDVGVVAAYGKILPQRLLDIPRHGMLNVHASLLPRYRGAAPIHRAVIAGETETGVTIIRLVRQLDAGPMLARCTSPIGPNDTSVMVEGRLAASGGALLVETLDALGAGRAIETPQEESEATYADRLCRDDGRIDWARPADAIHNQVRGLFPWPHAFTFLDGRRYVILQTTPVPPADLDVTHAWPAPGTVVVAAGDRLIVATGHQTAIAINEIQPEGGRRLPIRAFLAGRHVAPGLRFQPAP